MRCKTCHYSLENLTEHRCPECGTPFDPNDPATFDTVVRARSRVLDRLGWAIVVAMLVASITVHIQSQGAFSDWIPQLLIFASAFLCLLGIEVLRKCRARQR